MLSEVQSGTEHNGSHFKIVHHFWSPEKQNINIIYAVDNAFEEQQNRHTSFILNSHVNKHGAKPEVIEITSTQDEKT